MQTFLFAEDEQRKRVVNVASVPQRSPFRYPGGKTWFVPRLREWLSSRPKKPELLVEPFAGGGIVSLTAVFEDLAETALMVELDKEVGAVWQTVIEGGAKWLADRILSFEMTKDNAVKVMAALPKSHKEIAFQTIVKNRTVHGGILAAGSGFLKNGEGGKGILSRWYPGTLARRLRDIDLIRHKLRFENCDGFEVIAKYQSSKDTVFFIDPPYTAGGKKAGRRLYTHFELDHDRLFQMCAKIEGDFIMTYDNAEEVMALARKYGFATKSVPMKNTHHAEMTELVIGKKLGWMSGCDCVSD